jgi:YVTN family beta-propeller protein
MASGSGSRTDSLVTRLTSATPLSWTIIAISILILGVLSAPQGIGLHFPSTNTHGPEVQTTKAPGGDVPTDSSSVQPASYLVASIPVGYVPFGAAFDSVSGYVYVANSESHNVSEIDGTSVVQSILVGDLSPYGVVFDSANGYVYVTNYDTSNASVISGTSVVASIPAGSNPVGGVSDSANGYVYIANYGSNNVSVINGTTVVASTPVGGYPIAAAFDSNSREVYVANYGSNNVSVIEGTSVVGSIPVGAEPDGAAFDSVDGFVYIVNYGSNNVSIINGTSVVATVSVGAGLPLGAAFDSLNGYVYVTGITSSTNPWGYLWVINGTSVVTSIQVGMEPEGVAFDSTNGYVYVVNSLSNNVSVLNGSVYYPSISSFSATPSTVEVGSTTIPTTTLRVHALSGEGVLTYSYTGLPTGCFTSNTSSLDCTPTLAGYYAISVYANNSLGFGATAFTYLTVNAALIVAPKANPNPADAGSAVDFTSNPAGGSGVNSYAWEFGDGTSSTVQNPSHSYPAPGVYSPHVWVNDSNGSSVVEALSILVDPELGVVLSVSSSTPSLGQSISIRAEAVGGAAPYSYAYIGLPPGCVSVNSSTIGCIPTQAGPFNLSVVVTDQNGVSTNSSTLLQIHAAPGGPKSIWSFLESPYFLGGLIAAILVVVLLAVVLYAVGKTRPGSGSNFRAGPRSAPGKSSPPESFPPRPPE